MHPDEHRAQLLQRIDDGLRRAHLRARRLRRAQGSFLWLNFAIGAVSTALAFVAAVAGQAGVAHLLRMNPGTGPEATTANWKAICGFVGGLNTLALFLGGAPKTLLLFDQAARASASEGSLRRLRLALDDFQHDPAEIEADYLALVANDPEIDGRPAKQPPAGDSKNAA
ncbi:MAG: hypothetical protein JO117_00650 [Verrucomicrobia bacterium]|nr:hypothetical protein [Verrucomicrobiota bacterium]MBV9658780.1 hypothetical protein [Verrucomicrobiota bacterium]